MIKIAFSLFTGAMAFITGTLVTLLLTGSLSYWSKDMRADVSAVDTRSCQVKEVDMKGRVFWTPCDEWARQNHLSSKR